MKKKKYKLRGEMNAEKSSSDVATKLPSRCCDDQICQGGKFVRKFSKSLLGEKIRYCGGETGLGRSWKMKVAKVHDVERDFLLLIFPEGKSDRQRVLNIRDIQEKDFQFVCRNLCVQCKYCMTIPCMLLGVSPDKKRLLTSQLQEIETSLRSGFPDCRVEPYGSFRTGFGLENSDLDVHLDIGPSITWPDSTNPSILFDIRARAVLVAKVLRRNERFQSAAAITKTRVPIVKVRIYFKNLVTPESCHF